MRGKAAILLLLVLAATALSACGRKNLPPYPPDAIEKPAHVPTRDRPVSYY